MKKLIALLLALVFILGLVGCGDAENRENETLQPAANENNLSHDQTKSVVVEDSLILVQSNDELSKPYENFLWANTWFEHGWLNADDISIYYKLSAIHNEIPQITYSDDFEIHYKDGVEFLSVSVYDSNFDRIHHNMQQEVIHTLEQGTYYLVIVVKVQGKYIETEEKYEYSGYECAYKLVINN